MALPPRLHIAPLLLESLLAVFLLLAGYLVRAPQAEVLFYRLEVVQMVLARQKSVESHWVDVCSLLVICRCAEVLINFGLQFLKTLGRL